MFRLLSGDTMSQRRGSSLSWKFLEVEGIRQPLVGSTGDGSGARGLTVHRKFLFIIHIACGYNE
jgi:hypothetical protein